MYDGCASAGHSSEMNTTPTRFSVDFARPADVPAIREFIHKFWRASHVLSESGELLRWSYLDAGRDRLNFVCGRLEEEIVSILGFIPTSHFDAAIPYGRDVCLALWKAREDIRRPGIGTALLRFLQKQLNPRTIAVVGINEDVARLYRALRYELVDLSHYYRANPAKRDFQLLAGNVQTREFETLLQRLRRSSGRTAGRVRACHRGIQPRQDRRVCAEPVSPASVLSLRTGWCVA